jgi:hypothetical protein
MNEVGWIGPLSEMLLKEIKFTVLKRYSVIEIEYIANLVWFFMMLIN